MELFFDTATEQGFLGVHKEGTLLEGRLLPLGLHNSSHLFTGLEQLLGNNGVDIGQITSVACGVGPGSYTGMRVALSAAQGICLARHIPLKGFCTLTAWSPQETISYGVILDARARGVYLLKVPQGGLVGPATPISWDRLAVEVVDLPLLLTPYLPALETRLASFLYAQGWPGRIIQKEPNLLALSRSLAVLTFAHSPPLLNY